MKRKVFLFFCILNFTLPLLIAQSGTLYTADNVLSNSHVNCILQDSKNYVWIATEYGLNKYDGNRFTTYLNNEQNQNVLLNNYVRTLFEDSKGRLWVGCLSGLMLYDRAEGTFKEVPIYFKSKKYNPHITSMIELPSGEIVVATSGAGLLRSALDFKSFLVDEKILPKLSSRYLTSVFCDRKGDLWVGSENQGLNLILKKDQSVQVFNVSNSNISNQISAICGDNAGRILIGTLNGGLYVFDKIDFVFRQISYVNSSIKLPVKSIYVDKAGNVLVGTDGVGLKILNQLSNRLEDYRLRTSMFSFAQTKVHSILQDKVGNLWLGLFQKGVFFSPYHPNKFSYIGRKSFYQNLVGLNCVMSVLKEDNNVLWVGTDKDGLYKVVNGKSDHFELCGNISGLSATIMSIHKTDNVGLWLASYVDGLLYFNKSNGLVKTYANNIASTNLAAVNKAMCLTSDGDKNIWVGTNGAGIQVFSSSDKKWVKQYLFHEEDSTGIANNWVNCILNDQNGHVWAGTYEGATKIDIRTGVVTNYRKNKCGLPGNVVTCILSDKEKHLWFGTTNGLSYFNPQTNVWKVFSKNNGLADNAVCAIQEDINGDVWISTFNGISKYNRNLQKFTNFYSADGLQGNEFTLGASCQTINGELVFGGVAGVSIFYPSDVNRQLQPSNCHLTGFYVFDKFIVKGKKSGAYTIAKDDISDVKELELNYKDNMISFEFSTFDFGNTQNISYEYFLDGLSQKWVKTEKGVNRISFTNLNYGLYKLRVKALLNNRYSDEKVVSIRIHPPYYLNTFAKSLYVILILVLGWVVYRIVSDRIKSRQELLRREHLEQVNEGKLQFFINISHEIRTPMSLIISPLERLLVENNDSEKRAVYQLMYRNAQRILRLINQLLDIRKIDKGQMHVKMGETDIVTFIDDLMTTFEYQSKKRGIHFEFLHNHDSLLVWIDSNNFDKVLVNILSNAFKFTPDNGEILVKLKTLNQHNPESEMHDVFEITVSDTGIGIEESSIERIFERFYQIDNTQTQVNFGTGIGLHLAKSLVELMHGVIFARNKVDTNGCEFVIRMPLGNAHLSNEEFGVANKTKISHIVEDDIEPQSKQVKNRLQLKPKTHFKMLIVEDDSEIRHYLVREFASIYNVDECSNGLDALDCILRTKPDVVISDVMMPHMDGISLCKRVKGNSETRHIPIILLTARTSDDDKAEGFDIGADAYIAKPFNIELLKKRVNNIIENRIRLEPKAMDTDENKALVKQIILKPNDQLLLEKIMKIINENIADPELNVEMLADGVGMSRVHMHRKLKELTNMSARDFIKSIRLKQAAELLQNKNLTVSEIAYALGFSNLSHFSTLFRDHFGVSPKEYGKNF